MSHGCPIDTAVETGWMIMLYESWTLFDFLIEYSNVYLKMVYFFQIAFGLRLLCLS